jgi:hypothetical protein
MSRACFALLVLTGCSCDLMRIAAARAGPGAVDCDAMEAAGDGTDRNECAVAAFDAGDPFYLTLPDVAIAFVSDGTAGSLLFRDSDPSDGGHTGAVVTATACLSLGIDTTADGVDVVSCEWSSDSCIEQICGPGTSSETPCPS